MDLVLILDPNKAFDVLECTGLRFLPETRVTVSIKLMVAQLVLARLPQIPHGKGVEFVCLCGGEDTPIHPTVCLEIMSSNTSFKFHLGLGLGPTEQESSVIVPQSPRNQVLYPPAPTKNTMHVIIL